ncbi:outer membrane beta-barrel protein [Aquisphaera insulae]|uniref:outer membrane beta-barrel protein n=1 Tax=Aquisphaera insulae TaxID=2712864 RepID=UPI00202F42EE|nr:outer membrane beta-barrel protein [Aquisphaera insulae]
MPYGNIGGKPGYLPGSHGLLDRAVRQVQTPGTEAAPQPPVIEVQPPAPATQPPVSPDAAVNAEPGVPGANTSDLSLPASERAFGGGEPTASAAAGEEAEAGNEDTRGLLMKFLDIPADSDWKVYGWIQNSYTGNTNGFGNGFNFGVNPNYKANSWMGNQYYLILEKPLKQNDEVNWGFRIDNLFGNDWQFNYMQGLFNGAFRPGQFSGYDMAQLYGEVHLPFLTKGGLDVKGGRFYTLAGYEVVPAVARPLLSVPYMFNYGQPFTHVGLMTTLHLTDKINLFNGTINGWDRWINDRYIWGYMGGFAWTSQDDKTSLAFTCVWGPNQYPSFLPANQQIYPTGYINIPSVAGLNNPGYKRNDRTLFTTVLTHKWNDKLTQVLETDQGWERDVPGLGAPVVDGVVQNAKPKQETWYSFGNWFLYAFSDKLMGVWRSEVFWDTNGARTGLLVGDTYYEQTLGCQIKPYEWLWIRPEARYDWSQFHPSYSNNTRNSQFTLAVDAIFIF